VMLSLALSADAVLDAAASSARRGEYCGGMVR
jgi:hypothetical protein